MEQQFWADVDRLECEHLTTFRPSNGPTEIPPSLHDPYECHAMSPQNSSQNIRAKDVQDLVYLITQNVDGEGEPSRLRGFWNLNRVENPEFDNGQWSEYDSYIEGEHTTDLYSAPELETTILQFRTLTLRIVPQYEGTDWEPHLINLK